MNAAAWALLVTAYPSAVALIIVWISGASRGHDPEPPAPATRRRPRLRVEVRGREVARFEIIEHAAPDGEILEFHIPPPETPSDWTVDEVADLVAAFDALPQAPELETL